MSRRRKKLKKRKKVTVQLIKRVHAGKGTTGMSLEGPGRPMS